MSHGPVVAPLDPFDPVVGPRLVEVQRAAYRIEADLIGSDAIPQLHESLEDLRSAGEIWIGASVDERLVGAISYRIDGDTLDIHRLVVDPTRFRQGIAGRLLDRVHAVPGVGRFVVSTGAANHPARSLYEGAGYRFAGTEEVVPGLMIARYERLVAAG